jgi:hypothetical protein
MGGIFRITKAEFIKILKKPGLYIMGTLLAAVILLSSLLFSPQTTTNYTSNYNLNLSSESVLVKDLYEKFYSNSGSDTFSSLNNNFINAQSEIDFYLNYNSRNLNINKYYIEVLEAYQNLKLVIDSEGPQNKITEIFDILKTSIQNLHDEYNDHYNLTDYNFYNAYTTLSVFTEHKNNLTNLLNKINEATITPASFITYYEANVFTEKLLNAKNAAINLINETIKFYIKEIETAFNIYLQSVLTNVGAGYVPIIIEPSRLALKSKVDTFVDYYNKLVYEAEIDYRLSERLE